MLSLAIRLRTVAPEALTEALRRRSFESTGVHDVFDLAEALLRDDSIDAALSRLSRRRLAVLAAANVLGENGRDPSVTAIADAVGVDVSAAAAAVDALQALFLLTGDGEQVHPLKEVGARLAAWPLRGLPDSTELAAPPPPSPVTAVPAEQAARIDALAAERAFSTLRMLADLITTLSIEPARELGRGGLALPDARRLSEKTGAELDRVHDLLGVAASAGLVRLETGEWMQTPLGEGWLGMGSVERWRFLAESWRSSLPAELLEVLASRAELTWGATLLDDVHWLYPAGGPWLDERIAQVGRVAEAIGLATRDGLSEMGVRVLSGELDAASATLAGLLPHHVDKVYLQHDLSIVSPGPLEPTLDTRLRLLADVEGRELASSYRVSAGSINRALASGETAASLHEFLASISLTGVPQPLAYLVDETASRYGRVRVGALSMAELPHRSYVRSDDEQLIRTIEVDRALAPISLARADAHRLVSRFAPDVVLWALSDARYPVAAEDAEGAIVRVRRQRTAKPVQTADPRDHVAELVERVRSAAGDDLATDQAWMVRQLESAARTKQSVTVSVRMPDGGTSDYLLEPTSVANGRVRARDRRADIERTLPLSAIAAIRESAQTDE